MKNSSSSPAIPPVREESSLSQRERVRVRARTFVIYSLLIALLYFALRNAPLRDIWKTLSNLQFWQILTLLGINVIIYLLITLRWWLIVRAEKKSISFFPLLGIRVAVFGVSYFTLGPQVGGEPLQVLYLERKYGMTYTRATSTVVMDKLLEFLANFILLSVGLTAILQAGILSANGSRPLLSLSGLIIPLMWPPIHIIFLYKGKYPISAFLRKFSNNRVVRFIAAAERMAGTFCRRHLSSLARAIFVSVLAALGMVGEFFLITSFLGIHLSFWQIVAAWTAGWLAFLVPVPGGLGALEASQVFALGAFGISAASAIGVALLIRARDILIGGFGLLLAGRGVKK
ncbi:MAG: flippase-like domain-containing protein [Chloroflexi bacterium]|nr:flippase-like domain-containing protein [Chloroflexota bacterium]